MGLLSDPVMRQKFLVFLERWKTLLSFLGFVFGLLWMAFLASDDFNGRTYISENALLPAMVETRYSEDHAAQIYYGNLIELCQSDLHIQRNWIADKMSLAGLEVFHQHFSCSDGNIKGENVFGILRSPRSSGVESLVLNIPNRLGCKSNGALALMLSVIEHFKFQNYWAKDIIFLVTECDSCGVAAWLASYHGNKQQGIEASDLQGHAGKIQAALVVDIAHDAINGFDVLYEGMNGLEPNLDLISMAFAVSRSEGISIKLHTQDAYHGFADKAADYLRCLKTLGRSILQLASGFPSGEHGQYIKYRIEAITLKNAEPREHGNEARFNEMGRAIEGMFRSFNNLQEHFHQSFFMYLLPASDRYISIALYMPVLGGILLGPLLHSVSLWMDVIGLESTKSTAKQEINAFDLVCAVAYLSISVVFGFILNYTFPILIQSEVGTVTDGNITLKLLLASLVLLFSFRYINILKNEKQWKVVKMLTIFCLTAVIAMTSLLNFSLALLLAIPLVPAALFVDFNSNRLLTALSHLLVLIASPIAVTLTLSVMSIKLSESSIETIHLFKRGCIRTDSVLRYAIDNRHLGIWTLDMINLVVLPLWFAISGLACPRMF